MYEEENLTHAEKALESALSQLKPITNTLNRDTFMFNAGRASAGRKWSWQILSGLLTILLFFSVLIRPNLNGRIVPSGSMQNQVRIVQNQYQPAQAESPDSMAYPRLRENIIKYGLDALPLQQTKRYNEPIRNQKQWLDNMLSS